MRSRRAIAPVLAAGVVLIARAAAASPQARLVYGRAEGAEVCPDENALRRAVAARIGYDPFFPTSARTVVVTIVARGGRFAAHVQLIDDEAHAQGARVLESSGRDCTSLFDTVALTVSIAIDPQALARPSVPPPPVVAATPPLPASPTPLPVTPLDDPPHDSGDWRPLPPADIPRARLGASARSSIGLAPGAAFGFAIGGFAVWRHASLGAEASIDLPATKHVSSSESVSAWLFAGTLVPCIRLAPMSLCALASVGRFAGSADGVTSPQPRAALFLGFGARVGVDLPLSDHVAFGAHADALVNASPAILRVGSTDEWTASPVAGILSLGVVASF